jgi:hypothetical protein
VVSTRATATTTPVLAVATPGRSTTPRATGDTVRCRTLGVHGGWWLWKISLFEDVFIPTKTRFCDFVIESSGCEPNATDLSDRMLAKTFLSLFLSMIPLTKYDDSFLSSGRSLQLVVDW